MSEGTTGEMVSSAGRVDLRAVKAAYERGENITKLLRDACKNELSVNELEAIEIAYELQAGSYSQGAIKNFLQLSSRAGEIAAHLAGHLQAFDTVLDCGTGEMTTLSCMSQHLPTNIKLMAFDISPSRLNMGRRFAQRAMRMDVLANLEVFVGSMGGIPLPDNSVDVITSNHALEPNHGREADLLREMLRVTRRKLVLFEPSFEDNSAEGQQRMRELGYIRKLDMHIKDVGAVLVDKIAMHNISNPLNPTFCYVIQKVGSCNHSHIASTRFTCPISGEVLEERDDYLWSAAGYAYPKINGMPLLREKDAILMCYE